MEASFKVGNVVMQQAGGLRMKITAVDKESGRIRCSWTRGPAKYTQTFDAKDLILSTAVALPLPAVPPARRR
ncbi:Uncharacterized conserved protein YodC, DUF2158 family [Solimonas aquatica]|uniref:Uncharacterized conserved protein YodC, DUF2158 family n=1 Tax=Solimonas aquatica TaxID=489703 RepID=A0A1H9IUQ5_9GAMM|nr:hypothetical protein [Solimonas aquatica]SEQ78269.1 Uncharacterized conserved protein YodC, DUF2158 family [Solimonas aquatica]